jgi:tetratricopeptide (TPR) repeat protein
MNDPFILRAAIESISKAIEIAPTNPQYLCERATLLVKLERYDQAELDIKTLASLPKSNDLLLATHVENTINNVTEALKQYNISTTPNHSAKILVAKPGASPADGKPVYVGSTDLFATKPTAIDKKPTAMDKSTQCDEKSFQ